MASAGAALKIDQKVRSRCLLALLALSDLLLLAPPPPPSRSALLPPGPESDEGDERKLGG
jgi:hypothetical protein